MLRNQLRNLPIRRVTTVPPHCRLVHAHRFASRFPRQYKPRRNYTKILLTVIGSLGVISTGLWYFYWPHHTFTSNVARILRKGLTAESQRGGKDYSQALKYYIEALEQAQSEKLDPLSDEYTGIQLKIGEMMERLDMRLDALTLYSEISAGYLNALTTPGLIPHSLRPHFIQKDLRVVIKIVELNTQDAQMCKMLLLTHLLVAQQEVSQRSATAAQLISKENETDPQILTLEDIKNEKVVIINNREAWHPFADELFAARDLYVAICLATGDIGTAARAKTATTEWMLNADRHPGDILMSQTNLGSIMYLNAEAFEDKLRQSQTDQDKEYNLKAKEQSMNLAVKCYESVLEFAKNLPANLRRDERLEESIALSTYGLGVIKLYLGDHQASLKLLREARLRAKGSGFTDLVVRAEEELKKVNAINDTDGEKEKFEGLLEKGSKTIDFTVQLGKRG